MQPQQGEMAADALLSLGTQTHDHSLVRSFKTVFVPDFLFVLFEAKNLKG